MDKEALIDDLNSVWNFGVKKGLKQGRKQGIPHGGDGDLYGIGRRGRVQADGADHVYERRA